MLRGTGRAAVTYTLAYSGEEKTNVAIQVRSNKLYGARHTQVQPDGVNWLGIKPREEWFSEEEILAGEVQCARIENTVVYMTRSEPTPRPRPFKVTTWVRGMLTYRWLCDTLPEAQAAFTAQVREISVLLATKVLTHGHE